MRNHKGLSVVFFKKMKAIYAVESKGCTLSILHLSFNFSTTKNRGLVICVHITVTLFCSHLCCVAHPYQNGLLLATATVFRFFSLKQVLFVLL